MYEYETRYCKVILSYTHTVVECLELSAPINGTVRLPTLTAFGFVANYSCINRNTLIGQDQRECMANGQWSGTEPTCQRMLLWLYRFLVNARNCLQVLYLLYCSGKVSTVLFGVINTLKVQSCHFSTWNLILGLQFQ